LNFQKLVHVTTGRKRLKKNNNFDNMMRVAKQLNDRFYLGFSAVLGGISQTSMELK